MFSSSTKRKSSDDVDDDDGNGNGKGLVVVMEDTNVPSGIFNDNNKNTAVVETIQTDTHQTSSSVPSPRLLLMKVFQGFLSLRGSPPELYKAYVLKFLDSYSYFSFSIIFTLFLSEDFDFSDVQAGSIYGLWGALITVYGLLTGVVVDNLGVAKSLKLGFFLSLIARIGIFITSSWQILLFHIFVTLPIGNCLGIPVLTTGIRRYTTSSSRGFAFGLFYVIMNIAALISGPTVDFLTIWSKRNNDDDEDNNAENGNDDKNPNIRWIEESVNDNDDGIGNKLWTFSGYRAIVLTGLIANIIACLITLTIREIKIDQHPNTIVQSSINDDRQNRRDDKQATATAAAAAAASAVPQSSNDGEDELGPRRHDVDHLATDTMIMAAAATTPKGSSVAAFSPIGGTPMQIFNETIREPSFRRFLVVCLVTLNVRMIFRHMDATLPKYMIREFGDDVPKGTIYSINPALIIILVPLVTAGTTHIEPLTMIHFGTYISAISVFFLVFSTSITACILFVTVLSIGEAIWSPRLYDYTMSICREGREGTYMALSSAPLFLAKLPVGFLSGYLLQQYCPEDGERHSRQMWLIIGLLTASSPVLLTVLWGYVTKRDATEEDEESRGKYTELTTR